MKTLFGMTAAVMMVVTMPGDALAGKKECDPLLGEKKPGEPFLLTKGACINGTRLNEYQSTWHWCNTNGTWGPARRGYPVYWQPIDCCNNGDWRGVKLNEFKIIICKKYQKIEGQICANSQWKKTGSFAWFGVGNAPNGTVCNDLNQCTQNDVCKNGICEGKPIQHASPHDPKCLTK